MDSTEKIKQGLIFYLNDSTPPPLDPDQINSPSDTPEGSFHPEHKIPKPSQNRKSKNQETESRSSRRSSDQSGVSRTNSCSRTPLGDGRRGSTCRKQKQRRRTTARRKDSVRPSRTEVKEGRKEMEEARELEQARRHRRIAMIILGTFLFLLAASVLVVVVTLTHSSFQTPAAGSRELTEHRAQLRRENEELLNSLNRDSFVPENSTMPP